MVYKIKSSKKNKPDLGDVRIKRKFILFPVPNIYGDKMAWFEECDVCQVYDEYEGMRRWKSVYFIEK